LKGRSVAVRIHIGARTLHLCASVVNRKEYERTQLTFSRFDSAELLWNTQVVKASKPVVEKKTAGALAVERHRPLMNKLSAADRRRLHRRAAELLYGRETAPVGR
jgi:hypothetical protein